MFRYSSTVKMEANVPLKRLLISNGLYGDTYSILNEKC
jgi:hypothetical protein